MSTTPCVLKLQFCSIFVSYYLWEVWAGDPGARYNPCTTATHREQTTINIKIILFGWHVVVFVIRQGMEPQVILLKGRHITFLNPLGNLPPLSNRDLHCTALNPLEGYP